MSSIYRHLNNQIYNEKFISEGLLFLNSNKKIFPSYIKFPSQKERFQKKYHYFIVKNNNELFVKLPSSSFYIFNNNFNNSNNFNSSNNSSNSNSSSSSSNFILLKVIPFNQINSTLQNIYNNIGDIGRDRFYGLIKQKFIGISKRKISEFLNNQELHQLTRRVRRQKVSLPIISSYPMQRWQADLADVHQYRSSFNRFTTFLLTVIDCFSKYAWVKPLKNKKTSTVSNALHQIFIEAGSPHILQSDNGSEFISSTFSNLLKNFNVHHIKSSPYSPNSNGQIERFNSTIKRMIKTFLLSNQTKTYINNLHNLVKTYNSIPHSTTKQSPINLHFSSSNSIIQKKSKHLILKNAQQQIKKSSKKHQFKKINVGDYVRIALRTPSQHFSHIFFKGKSGLNSTGLNNKNDINSPLINWSTQIFIVNSIFNDKQNLISKKYKLNNNKIYTRDRLLKINKNLNQLVKINKKQKKPKKKNYYENKNEIVLERRAPSKRKRRVNRKYKDFIM